MQVKCHMTVTAAFKILANKLCSVSECVKFEPTERRPTVINMKLKL